MHSNHYKSLARAIAHFERFGYQHIDATWVTTKDIAMITAPCEARLTPFTDGLFLVGSGEQSFLSMISKGTLLPGKYQTTTPCFRNEPVVDELHKRYFLKNELIVFEPVNPERALKELLKMCMKYVMRLARGHAVAVTESTPSGERDITVNGIEVGSYGIRTHQNYTWVYGTGHAEPRMSTAIANTQGFK